jgi:hypothetical protein
MSEETGLYDEITALIKPWRDDESEPPFLLCELITMALVMSSEEMDMHDIAAWISSTFKYYQSLMFRFPWSQAYPDWSLEACSREEICFADLWDATTDYNMPVKVTNVESYNDDVGERSLCTFKISSFVARQYLEHILPLKRRGRFPFLSLPPELRNAVYKRVFTYPSSGLEIQHHTCSSHPMVRGMSRNYSDPFSYEKWDSGCPPLELSTIGDLLSLTLVNKQISCEAVPYFYELNTCFFGTPKRGLEMYSKLAASRREFLSSLRIVYTPWDRMYEPELKDIDIQFFQKLLDLKGLMKFCIEMNEKDWFRTRKNRRGGHMYSAGTIPGLNHLLALADHVEVQFVGGSSVCWWKFSLLVEVQFVGDCPTIAANWKSETLKVVEAAAKTREYELKRKKASSVGTKQSTRVTKARKTSFT